MHSIFEHFVDVSIISHACLRWTCCLGACWTALHVVGVSLFCEAGSAVSGLVTRQLWWPWFACLASACEALMMHIIYFEHFVDVSVQSHMPVSAGLGCLGHVGRRYTW